jgi:seryl-tRNA synthetase
MKIGIPDMRAVTMEQAGLPTLVPAATTLLKTLDTVLEGWATAAGAASMIMPPLLPVAALARLDFFDNFPHQALLVSPLDMTKQLTSEALAYASETLEPASLALPSAACFAVYLYHRERSLPDKTTVTVLGRCFRREERYEDLRRLLGFHMREIVALGTPEFVQDHLRRFGDRILAFAAALDLPIRKEAATDPFYDRGGPRALLQKLAPVKHELLVEDLAVASLNTHRNFFGQRCAITLAGTGRPLFTGCVAFGLERWLAVLLARFGSWEAAVEAVRSASAQVGAAPP